MSRQSGRCRRRWSTARPGPPSGREEAANGIHVKLPVGVPGRKAGEAARRRHGRARPDQVAVRRGNGCGRAVVLAGEGAGDGSLGPVIETYAIGAAAAATGGGEEIVLPQVIVATGPAAVGRFLEFFVGTIAHATRAAYARTVGHFPGVVRGARPRAARRLAAPRGRLHPDPPRVGPHGEAALGRDPHARRLARRQPSPPGEPAPGVRGPKHVVTKGATPVLSPGGGEEGPPEHRHGRLGRAPGPSATLGHALQPRAAARSWRCGGRTTSGRGDGAG